MPGSITFEPCRSKERLLLNTVLMVYRIQNRGRNDKGDFADEDNKNALQGIDGSLCSAADPVYRHDEISFFSQLFSADGYLCGA